MWVSGRLWKWLLCFTFVYTIYISYKISILNNHYVQYLINLIYNLFGCVKKKEWLWLYLFVCFLQANFQMILVIKVFFIFVPLHSFNKVSNIFYRYKRSFGTMWKRLGLWSVGPNLQLGWPDFKNWFLTERYSKCIWIGNCFHFLFRDWSLNNKQPPWK